MHNNGERVVFAAMIVQNPEQTTTRENGSHAFDDRRLHGFISACLVYLYGHSKRRCKLHTRMQQRESDEFSPEQLFGRDNNENPVAPPYDRHANSRTSACTAASSYRRVKVFTA